jgi:tetratricopeptide (TPR) repeat protein
LFVLLLLAVVVASCAEPTTREKMMMRYDTIDPGANFDRMPVPVQETIKSYNDRDYHAAAIGFYNIMQNPEWQALHDSSKYYFSECLYRLGLYQACQYELTDILFKGPENNAYFTSALIKMLAITYETRDQTIMFSVLADIPLEKFPKKFRNELIYLLGKMYFYQGQYGQAYVKFSQVEENSAFYAKALYFRGIIEVKRKEYQKAEDTFAKIQDVPVVAVSFGETRLVKEMSRQAVGQLYYAAAHDAQDPEQREKIFMEAITYYDLVDRDNPQWFEAQFEKTWAATMIGRYGISLGTSLTLTSPFFEDRFVPEVHLIEAITWYTLCKYGQARETLDAFFEDYSDMHARVEVFLKLTAGMESADIYENLLEQYATYFDKGEASVFKTPGPELTEKVLRGFRVPGGTVDQRLAAFSQVLSNAAPGEYLGTARTQVILPIQVLTHVLNQQLFVNYFTHVKEIHKEFGILKDSPQAFRGLAFYDRTMKRMTNHRSNIQKKAGKWATAELASVETMLAELLGNAYNIDLELTDAERRRLEEEARYGVEFQSQIAEQEELLLSPAVPDSFQYWPFDGEYWRDELGYYIMAVEQECQ